LIQVKLRRGLRFQRRGDRVVDPLEPDKLQPVTARSREIDVAVRHLIRAGAACAPSSKDAAAISTPVWNC
jgi:hypothetical protein